MAAPMAKTIIFSALNHYVISPQVGSSLADVTCETSQVLLAGGVSRFRSTYRLARLNMSEIILTGRKTQIKILPEKAFAKTVSRS